MRRALVAVFVAGIAVPAFAQPPAGSPPAGSTRLAPSTREIVAKHQLAANAERRVYREKLSKIENELLRDLAVEQQQLARAGRQEEAAAVRYAIEKVKSGGIEKRLANDGTLLGRDVDPRLLAPQGEVVYVTSKSERGYEIGPLPRGSTIALQYVSGSWKGWADDPTENPDAREQEKGNRCRLAVAATDPATGATQVVAVVPPGTSVRPFVWRATQDLHDVVLRINDDDGKFSNNPDGRVHYRVKLTLGR